MGGFHAALDDAQPVYARHQIGIAPHFHNLDSMHGTYQAFGETYSNTILPVYRVVPLTTSAIYVPAACARMSKCTVPSVMFKGPPLTQVLC